MVGCALPCVCHTQPIQCKFSSNLTIFHFFFAFFISVTFKDRENQKVVNKLVTEVKGLNDHFITQHIRGEIQVADDKPLHNHLSNYKYSGTTVQWEIFVSINFHESPTHQEKTFAIFII